MLFYVTKIGLFHSNRQPQHKGKVLSPEVHGTGDGDGLTLN